MSIDKIQKLVSSLAKTIESREKIATPVLAVKLAKYSEAYPHDQTIGSMSVIIDKMALNNKLFITKLQLRELYNKLYSNNTKFADLFQNEMSSVEEQAPIKTYEHDNGTEINQYEYADPILANALNSVFDKSLPLKMYSETLSNKAKLSVSSTLDSWNLKPSSIEINDGNDKFLVIKADYETPKGITSIYVPVEIINNKICEASVFMGNSGPQELNHLNIKSYITSNAGNKLKVNAGGILSALTTAASENREVSGVELALIRLKSNRMNNSEFSQNQIVGQKISEASVKDIELPKSDEFVSFEKTFTSAYGQAAFKFGSDKVKLSRENIVRELVSLGHKLPQVTVSNIDENTIFYGVSLDSGKVAFTVPVKINAGKISKPSIMICNGSVSSFDKMGINKLYLTNETDYKVAATASLSYGLKPSDLINEIRSALIAGNHAKAEDSLNVLANTGDTKAYAIGFKALVDGLNSEDKKVEASKCSLMIKNSTSEHPICSHTGLPVHKVFQDKDGNCQPMYRKGMDETYEGASFMNAKIFG